MANSDNFGELLIESLEEAVAYKQGLRPELRVTRYEVTSPPSSPDAEHGPEAGFRSNP